MFANIFRQMPPVTKNLLIINFIIWAAMAFVPAVDIALTRNAALYYIESDGFRPWQVVTYMFVHGGFAHLFFNMFALMMFGGIIEYTLGSKRFLFYYLSCGIGAALIQEGVFALMAMRYHEIFTPDQCAAIVQYGWQVNLYGSIPVSSEIFNLLTDPSAQKFMSLLCMPTVGASGAIYGILLAFGMLYPNRQMFIMFIPVPVKAKWVVLGYGVLELLMGVGNVDSSVAHFAHLGGMLFGFFMLWYWKKKGDFRGWY